MKKKVLENLKSNWKPWLTVALINVPLSISIAVASGASPLQGLLTAIWGWLFAAIFASSRHNVFWVAWALTSILLSFAMTYWPVRLPILAIITWVIIILISLLKLTKYITLLPSTVLHWFLISVWISIALGQVSLALWLNNPALHIHQHEKIYMNLWEVITHIWSTNIAAFIMFLCGFVFLFVSKKKFPKLPSVIILTVVWTLLGFLVSKWIMPDVLLLSDKFQNLQFHLFQIPFFNLEVKEWISMVDMLRKLLSTSFVIAIIAILETNISAKIAEKMTQKKFNKDKEVFGLWMSNLFSGLFGWLPSTAVFIRTALNIKSGWTSKYSSWITSILTLVISALLLTNFFIYLPFPIIAAILMNIALWLVDVAMLKNLYKLEKKAFYITLLVAFIAVVEEPTYGIVLWSAISLLIFLKWVTNWDIRVSVFRNKEFLDKLDLHKYLKIQDENDIVLIKFIWWLNYLNIENNMSLIQRLNKKQKVIISFSHMWTVDLDGFENLEDIVYDLKAKDITVYFAGISEKKEKTLSKLHYYDELKKEWRIISSSSLALQQLLA